MKEDLGRTMNVNTSQHISSKRSIKKSRSRIKHSDKMENQSNLSAKSDHNNNLSSSSAQKFRMINAEENKSGKKGLNPLVKSFVPRNSNSITMDPISNSPMTFNYQSTKNFQNIQQSQYSSNQSNQLHDFNEAYFDIDSSMIMKNSSGIVVQRQARNLGANFSILQRTVPFECSAKLQMELQINDSIQYQRSYEITQDLSLSGNCKSQNSTCHPLERYSELTLQQLKDALTNSPKKARYSQEGSRNEDTEQMLCQYTLQEVTDYFNSSDTYKKKGNPNNCLAKYNINSETTFNISKFFSCYTILDIANILNHSKNQSTSKHILPEGSKNFFGMFTGYTLKDVIACLNVSKSIYSPLNKFNPCPKIYSMPNGIRPKQIPKIRFGRNDEDKMYFGQVQMEEPNQNRTSRYAFARKEIGENVNLKNSEGFILKKTEISYKTNESFSNGQDEDNSIYFSELNANQYYTLQTFNDTIYHTKSLIEQTEEQHIRRHLCLHPEDVDKLNSRQALSLVSNNDVKIKSDYCRKFGHSNICPYESSCMFKDHEFCPHCGLYCIPRNDYQGAQKHKKECEWNLNLDRSYEVLRMKDKESDPGTCQLCKKVVSKKASIHERLYGILPSCDHVYCIECAEKCRVDLKDADRKNVVICKICRVCSPFYAASFRLIKKSEKREFLIGFIETMKSIKCRSCRDSSCEVLVGTRICYHGRTIPTINSMFSNLPLYRKQCFKLKSLI